MNEPIKPLPSTPPQVNYSETLEKLHVVDAPFIFSTCWALIRPWLDPVTAAKVGGTYTYPPILISTPIPISILCL
ncbi:hypothetical protein EON65_36405 [archaeon]|nr:MAG: hypothetical protein EON65_36405 [archaeon]